MRSLKQFLDDYQVSHQNPVNAMIHLVCVPAIFFSSLGLLWAIPVGRWLGLPPDVARWVNPATLLALPSSRSMCACRWAPRPRWRPGSPPALPPSSPSSPPACRWRDLRRHLVAAWPCSSTATKWRRQALVRGRPGVPADRSAVRDAEAVSSPRPA